VTVAVETREGEIPEFSQAAVLSGEDMINWKGDGRIAGLGHSTILTGVAGPATDDLS